MSKKDIGCTSVQLNYRFHPAGGLKCYKRRLATWRFRIVDNLNHCTPKLHIRPVRGWNSFVCLLIKHAKGFQKKSRRVGPRLTSKEAGKKKWHCRRRRIQSYCSNRTIQIMQNDVQVHSLNSRRFYRKMECPRSSHLLSKLSVHVMPCFLKKIKNVYIMCSGQQLYIWIRS
jgi:hypothetical protein